MFRCRLPFRNPAPQRIEGFYVDSNGRNRHPSLRKNVLGRNTTISWGGEQKTEVTNEKNMLWFMDSEEGAKKGDLNKRWF
mmetsp:Transcript_15600/g.15791  ORF Transcript_15600/g.15791 Transcript_15600/m.15791 type:complete len:80 (+) Transcript_15600:98-337(+)